MMYVIDIFSTKDVKAILNSMSWKEKVFYNKKETLSENLVVRVKIEKKNNNFFLFRFKSKPKETIIVSIATKKDSL